MKPTTFIPYLLAFSTLCLTGCGTSRPARLYVLHAPASIPVQAIHHEHLQGVYISLVRVRIPKHLDRPTVITQTDEVELAYSEYARWAGPLADNIEEVLLSNLTTLLPGTVVAIQVKVGRSHLGVNLRIDGHRAELQNRSLADPRLDAIDEHGDFAG